MNIQSFYINAGKWACLSLCYLEMAGIADDNKTKYLIDAINKKYIEEDFYVAKPIKFLNMSGLKAKDIMKKQYVPSEEKQIVEWQYKGLSHFVIMQNDKIIYNSLDDSFVIKNGKPIWTRTIIK